MHGRGQVLVVELGGHELVLRRFRRGGLLGSLRGDTYVWTGLHRTRSFREWQLLHRLHAAGLPVPRPAAARVVRHGPFYRADIMTVRLPATTSLAQHLESGALGHSHWRHLGATLARFHDAGAYHADLNAMNLLLDADGQWYAIDWDKGRLMASRPGWQRANLRRLRRSLDRLTQRRPRFDFREQDWAALIEGYRRSGTGTPAHQSVS